MMVTEFSKVFPFVWTIILLTNTANITGFSYVTRIYTSQTFVQFMLGCCPTKKKTTILDFAVANIKICVLVGNERCVKIFSESNIVWRS